jgi:hydroxymethylbilane synthase
MVRARLEALHPGATFTECLVTTDGDRDQATPLQAIGGQGVFTSALERALRAGEIDFAVHSLKDLPIEQSGDLSLAAIGSREDARDALVSRNKWTLASLPKGARVGTCSTRRSAQLKAIRPDFTLLPLRGNVDTRVRQVESGAFDAIVLAAAGLHRLGLHHVITQYLSLDEMLPAPGQGALAVQCRADDVRTCAIIAPLDEAAVRGATDAERGVLEGLGGGCSAPVAAYAETLDGGLSLRAVVASHDGQTMVRVDARGALANARALGLALAAQARAQGAGALIA